MPTGVFKRILGKYTRARTNLGDALSKSGGTNEWKKSDEPMTRNIMELEALAQDKGARTWLYHQQGGRHCEEDWEVQIPTWMQFLWM